MNARPGVQTRRLSTNAFAAKRAIFAALKAHVEDAQAGSPLAGVAVHYSWPGNPGERMIYGGGFDFDQPGDNDLEAGQDDTLVEEVTTLGVHIRCTAISDGDEPIEDTDVLVEMIADALTDVVRSNPTIAGPGSRTRVAGGQGDYGPTDSLAASRLSLRLEVTSNVR